MKPDDLTPLPKPQPVSGISDSKLNLPATKKKTVKINVPPAPVGSQPIHLTTAGSQPERPRWKFWQR